MSVLSPFAYVLRQRGRLMGVGAWSVGVALGPLFSGRFIASAVDAANAGELAAALGWVAGLLVAGAVGVWSLLQMSLLTADAAAEVQMALTRDVVGAALADAVRSDRVLRSGAELTQHVPTIVDVLALMLRQAPNALFALGAVAGLATISLALLGLVLPWLVLSTLLLAVLVRIDTRNQTAMMLAGEASYGEMTQAIQGVRDLMALGAKGYAHSRVHGRIRTANRAFLKQSDQDALLSGAVDATATWLPAVVALAFVPTFVRNGTLTPGEVVGSFTYLLAGLPTASAFVSAAVGHMITLRVTHGRLLETAQAQQPNTQVIATGLQRPANTHIAVRDLTFRYGASAHPIVAGLKLDIPPGDHLAIVGPSGIGKSSLAALLAGVLAPNRGAVEIGGVPLHRREDRCQLVTMVPQEAYVFAGSLRDNLVYLRPSASDDEVLASAQAIGLERVLARLGGLDAEIDLAKSGLSAGEQQLVCLVRAHLSASPIVVLDEATCHLDPAAEDRAERAFMATGRTLIVVAHRMSATLRANRVLVMDADKIAIGQHAELLQRHALYADFHATWQTGVAGEDARETTSD